ncbi:formyl transferase [Brevundimonas sp.]|uniref:formyl transferase n=1 Tax=Brevundimonas sp. TaxID=1871086 RepID=UPI0039E295C4
MAITGDHPRHCFLARRLAEAGLLSGWIVERRKPFVAKPGDDVPAGLHELFNLHFARREDAEHRAFGALQPKDVNVEQMSIEVSDLNGPAVHAFLAERAPRIVLSYGCHKLDDATLNATPARFWNTHGGLSPWYRGVATHFWPSYLLEPQMTGVTLHETTSAIDGGAVFHQTGAPLNRGDGLHDLACATVKAYVDELPTVLTNALSLDSPQGHTQATAGRIWTSAMWRPEHLRVIYEQYQDRIVDLCLDGEITGKTPTLVRPFLNPSV